MSDFLSKIKGIFVVQVDENGKKVDAPQQSTSQQPVKTTSDSAPKPAPAAISGGSGKVSDQFYDILLGSMEQNNQEGFDYLEYKKSLKTLASVPMDEQTRYFSAFAAAQAMGVTSEKLVDSAQIYLNALKQEEDKFQVSIKNQREKQVGGKEKSIADTEATIKAKTEQIVRLTEEIKAHQADSEKMKAEISDAVVKIETTMNDFHATYSDLVGQIVSDVEKIRKYLK